MEQISTQVVGLKTHLKFGNGIRPHGEVLMAASILCLFSHTPVGATYGTALGLGNFEAGVLGPQLF